MKAKKSRKRKNELTEREIEQEIVRMFKNGELDEFILKDIEKAIGFKIDRKIAKKHLGRRHKNL